MQFKYLAVSAAALLAAGSAQAQYSDGVIKIGVLNDQSGLYADVSGPGGTWAAKKAVEDYGAAAKGNTLINYCGLGPNDIDYVVDRSPYKQGRYLPGSRIPIRDPRQIAVTRPDYLLILPWNLKKEIMSQTAGVRQWGGKFVIPVPEVAVLD